MNDLYLAIINQLDNGIILLDDQLNIQLWNTWLAKYTGKTEDEVKGLPITEVIPRFDNNIYAGMFEKALSNGQKSFCSAAMHQYFVEGRCSNMKQPRQNVLIRHLHLDDKIYVMIEIHDVASVYERIRNLNKSLQHSIGFTKSLERFAYYDSLTDLPNRKFILERIEKLIQQETIFVLFFLDLNGFKAVNDQFGHLQGDLLLQMFAKRGSQFICTQDVLARLGGDEFVLLVENLTTLDEIEQHMEEVKALLEEPFIIEGQQVVISTSIGHACFPRDGITANQLLNVADSKMYADKKEIK
ncbi:diguanylate cyclase domain-containing protein [Lysinibacillus piscis]|uniref:Sensor domain-containing diguanylate cyclase n=1 Tax=Lysinibacillus piscis TaxID=2518931 RepID=A0ABQ5NNF5_9BACI|nr:diguanylate cyclase [Lysinibacillus sp. KH24]GLC89643.1 hypothetical protein LYSBPC_27700 [Lysinibacillus sp. KH24]